MCCGAAGARILGERCCSVACCACIGTVRCCDNVCSRCNRTVRACVGGCLGILCCNYCRLFTSCCGSTLVFLRSCCSTSFGCLFCCGGIFCGAHGCLPLCGTACGDVEEQEYLSLRPDHKDSDNGEEDASQVRSMPEFTEQDAMDALVYTARGPIVHGEGVVAQSAPDYREPFDVDRDRLAHVWRRTVKRPAIA